MHINVFCGFVYYMDSHQDWAKSNNFLFNYFLPTHTTQHILYHKSSHYKVVDPPCLSAFTHPRQDPKTSAIQPQKEFNPRAGSTFKKPFCKKNYIQNLPESQQGERQFQDSAHRLRLSMETNRCRQETTGPGKGRRAGCGPWKYEKIVVFFFKLNICLIMVMQYQVTSR